MNVAGDMVTTGFRGSLARGHVHPLAENDEHIAKNVTSGDRRQKVKSPAGRGLSNRGCVGRRYRVTEAKVGSPRAESS